MGKYQYVFASHLEELVTQVAEPENFRPKNKQ